VCFWIEIDRCPHQENYANHKAPIEQRVRTKGHENRRAATEGRIPFTSIFDRSEILLLIQINPREKSEYQVGGGWPKTWPLPCQHRFRHATDETRAAGSQSIESFVLSESSGQRNWRQFLPVWQLCDRVDERGLIPPPGPKGVNPILGGSSLNEALETHMLNLLSTLLTTFAR